MIARTLLLFFAVITLAACQSPGGFEPAAGSAPTNTPAPAPTATASPEPTGQPTQPPPQETATEPVAPEAGLPAILGNLTYDGPFLMQPITLVDGFANYDDGSSTLPYLVLQDFLTPTADLDGDGTTDAIAVLVDNPSGSGVFTLLSAVFDVYGTPRTTEPVMIGDRISLKSLTIDETAADGPAVLADMITQGEGDAACCASWNGRMTLGLQDGRLVEQDLTLTTRIALSDLDGTAWRLVDLDSGDSPLPADVEVTAVFAGSELSGSAGCNNYSAALDAPADRPNGLTVTAVSTTDMLCDDDIMAVETAFLSHLALVDSWWFDGGRLALTYITDGPVYHHLLLEPAQ